MKGLTPDFEHLETLQHKVLKTFSKTLQGKSILYFDYPLYNNVGDWLIYHGTIALLKQLNCKIERQYCSRNYRSGLSKSIPEDWVVLMQGGGNFGDLYPKHQQLRREIVQAYPNNKIILMPQSIHFDDPANFEQDSQLFSGHKDLTLHLRDYESYAFLSEHLSENQLALTPDMASMLLDNWKWKEASDKTLFFRRRDCEAPELSEEIENSFDWEELFDPGKRRVMRQIAKLANWENKFKLHLGAAWLWQRYTLHLLKYAQAAFEDFNTVDTDRLHGMIFAILLGKKVILRDNSYGKIGRYTRAWFSELSHDIGN